MTTAASLLVWGLWIANILAEGYLFALLLGRGSYKQFPAFTALIGYCTLESLVLLYASQELSALYEVIMCITYVPQLVFIVMAVLEVFCFLFFPLRTLPKRTLQHFITAACTTIMIVAAITILYPGERRLKWQEVAWAMSQSSSMVTLIFFGIITIFASFLGIPWRHRVYGIGVGFFFHLTIDAVVTTLSRHTQEVEYIWPVGMLSFLISCLVWIYYFATPELSQPIPSTEQLTRLHAALRRIAASVDTIREVCYSESCRPIQEEIDGPK